MLTSTTYGRADSTVLRLSGVLDARSYQQVRNSVIKAAVDGTRAVIVDIDDLEVRDDHSWAVFTSARWHVQTVAGSSDSADHQRPGGTQVLG
jgi:anti-anti-sigma regulatory factor